MEWQHEVRTLTDVQPAFNINAILDQLIYLSKECLGIEHDTITNGAFDPRMENTARYLVENEGIIAYVDCMASIGAALVTYDPPRTLGEYVHQLALPLIAPLGANDYERTNII